MLRVSNVLIRVPLAACLDELRQQVVDIIRLDDTWNTRPCLLNRLANQHEVLDLFLLGGGTNTHRDGHVVLRGPCTRIYLQPLTIYHDLFMAILMLAYDLQNQFPRPTQPTFGQVASDKLNALLALVDERLNALRAKRGFRKLATRKALVEA